MKSSQSGSAIMMGLMAAGVVAIAAASIPEITRYSNRQSKVLRVKGMMNTVERKLRMALAEKQNYDPATGRLILVANPNSISIRGELYDFGVLGAECASSPVICGVKLQSLDDTSDPSKVSAVLEYNGDDVAVAQRSFTVDKPIASLADLVSCDDAANPLFLGINPDGTAKCGPLPSNFTQQCTRPGEALTLVDPANLTFACRAIGGGTLVDCGADNYIQDIKWNSDLSANTSFSAACVPRIVPTPPDVLRDVAAVVVTSPPPVTPPVVTPPPLCVPSTFQERWITVFEDNFDVNGAVDPAKWENAGKGPKPNVINKNVLYFPRLLNNGNAPAVISTPFPYNSKMKVEMLAAWGAPTGDSQWIQAWMPCMSIERGGRVNTLDPDTVKINRTTPDGCGDPDMPFGRASVKLGLSKKCGSGYCTPFKKYDGTEMRVDYVRVSCFATKEIDNGFDDDCNGIVDDVVPECTP